MILTFIAQAFVSVVNIALLPLGRVTELPLVDGYLSTGMGYIKFLIGLFPPLGTIYDGFLVYMGFLSVLLALRLLRIVR